MGGHHDRLSFYTYSLEPNLNVEHFPSQQLWTYGTNKLIVSPKNLTVFRIMSNADRDTLNLMNVVKGAENHRAKAPTLVA